MKSHVRYANVLFLTILIANLILPDGTVRRLILGSVSTCHANSYHAAGTLAALAVSCDPAVYTNPSQCLQAELWDWAWGLTYSPTNSHLSASASILDTSNAEGWSIMALNTQGETFSQVGTGTFTPSAIYLIATDVAAEQDETLQTTVTVTVTFSLVAGMFSVSRPEGSNVPSSRPVVGLVAQYVATEQANNVTVTTRIFTPVLLSQNLKHAMHDASELNRAADTNAAPPDPNDPIPCYENAQQSCACQCLMAYNNGVDACSSTLRDFLLMCLGGTALLSMICIFGCTSILGVFAAPCINSCMVAVGKAAADCAALALGNAAWCFQQNLNTFEQCLANCP